MKNWIYYLVPLALLIALVLVPPLFRKDGVPAAPPPAAPPPVQRAPEVRSTPRPQPASNPRGELLDINVRNPATGNYEPMVDGMALSSDAYHFNAKVKNTGNENTLYYFDVQQSDGKALEPLGAGEWLLAPGQDVFLFMQGANLKPPGKRVQLTFTLKERGTDKALAQKSFNVISR
ncbi:MAG: hypothetical protein HYY29_01135 [Chloroflexi bacterium]|nr:hypothetical protein [Chloroflexota bacterium]